MRRSMCTSTARAGSRRSQSPAAPWKQASRRSGRGPGGGSPDTAPKAAKLLRTQPGQLNVCLTSLRERAEHWSQRYVNNPNPKPPAKKWNKGEGKRKSFEQTRPHSSMMRIKKMLLEQNTCGFCGFRSLQWTSDLCFPHGSAHLTQPCKRLQPHNVEAGQTRYIRTLSPGETFSQGFRDERKLRYDAAETIFPPVKCVTEENERKEHPIAACASTVTDIHWLTQSHGSPTFAAASRLGVPVLVYFGCVRAAQPSANVTLVTCIALVDSWRRCHRIYLNLQRHCKLSDPTEYKLELASYFLKVDFDLGVARLLS